MNTDEDELIFAGMNVWKYSEERVFHYELIQEWLVPYSYQQVKDALLDRKADYLDDIQIIRDMRSTYLVFPDKKAVQVMIHADYEEAHLEENILKYTVVPAYSTEDGALDWGMPNQAIWDAKWVQDESENLDSISLGGITDFYTRFGWWPHVNDVEHRTTNEVVIAPLHFVGTINFDGVKGYIFNDIDYEVFGDYLVPFQEDGTEHSFALILENDLKVPEWIDKKELSQEEQERYITNRDYGENVEKRIVPLDSFPIIAPGCQDDYTLKAPFNNFVIQIPVIYHGFDEYDGFYRVNEGDCGSLTICTNNQGEYRAAYQQT